MEGPSEKSINYNGIPYGELEVDISVDENIDKSVGKSIEDHSTPPLENEGTSAEIVDDALNDVG